MIQASSYRAQAPINMGLQFLAHYHPNFFGYYDHEDPQEKAQLLHSARLQEAAEVQEAEDQTGPLNPEPYAVFGFRVSLRIRGFEESALRSRV